MVGGLGLGYTAQTVLEDPRVRALVVVDALAPVIDWHERGSFRWAASHADARCRLIEGDFFAMSDGAGFDPDVPGEFDAVLLDIDHSPRHLLNPANAVFYELEGMRRLADIVRAACSRCGRTIRRTRSTSAPRRGVHGPSRRGGDVPEPAPGTGRDEHRVPRAAGVELALVGLSWPTRVRRAR